MTIDYSLPDTTPPASITNLANSTATCEEINWTWANPADADFNHTYILKDDVFYANLSNTTTHSLWTGLTGGQAYTFSSKTVDITGNMNATWVNMTATPGTCAAAPVADFTVDNQTVCEGGSFQFNDTSTNTPDGWYWMFGDTDTSALQNPSHIYENIGTYDVFLNASNSVGFDWENKSQFVNVIDCTSPDNISNLNGTVVNCSQIYWTWTLPKVWDYDHIEVYKNGTFLYNLTTETSDTWADLGEITEYTFSSRSVDIYGNVNPDWVNATVNTTACGYPPSADFVGNTTCWIGKPLPVQFNGTCAYPVKNKWFFGDGNTTDDELQNPLHLYEDYGNYTVNHYCKASIGDDYWENKTDYIILGVPGTFCADNCTGTGSSYVGGRDEYPNYLIVGATIGLLFGLIIIRRKGET